MPAPITIRVELDPVDIPKAGKQIARQLESALDSSLATARNIGQQIGNALTKGLLEAITAANKLRDSLNSALAPRNASGGARKQIDDVATALRKQETDALSLARAQARLEVTQGKAAQAATTLRTALVGVTDGTQGAIRAQTQLAAVQNKLEGQTKRLADGMQSVGTALSVSVTAPLLLAGREVLKVGIDYEKSMNLFQAATKATAVQMKAAADEAKKLGADITLPATSAGDAAKAMTELAKAGLTAEQAIAATRGTLQLAAAAGIDEARAAEIAANALNAFKLPASEATKVADLLAAAANASSAEINDVALAMQQSAATAATLKVPIGDLTTAIALMANAGIKGSDAGTSLKTAFINLNPASTKAAEAMQSIGFNAFNASGQLKPLRQIVEEFTAKTKDLTDQQRLQVTQTIFGTDALRAALIVFGGGVAQFDKLSTAVNASGAAAEQAAARTKGLGGAWDGLKSQIETGALVVFERISPTLEKVIRQLTDMAGNVAQAAGQFAQAHPNITTTAIALTAVAAAIGPLLFLLGSLGKSVLTIIEVTTAIRGLTAAIGTASAAGTAAGAFTLLNPIVLGISAALIAGAAIWYTYSTQVQQSANVIESAARRASGSIELLDGQRSSITKLADGTNVTLIPGRDTSILLPPGPRIGGAPAAAPAGGGRTGGTNNLRNLLGGGGGRGGSQGGGLDQALAEQAENARVAIEQAKLLRPQFAALTEDVNRLNNELLAVGGVLTKEIGEIPLQRRILVLRAEIQKLRDEARGIVDFPEIAKLNGPLVSALGAGIPGGEIPTPQVIRDLSEAIKEIPPAPPVFQELSRGAREFAQVTEGLFNTLIDRGPAAFFDDLLSIGKRTLAKLLSEFITFGSGASQATGGGILGFIRNLFSGGGAASGGGGGGTGGTGGGGGGGILGNIFSGISNLFRTPNFNSSAAGGGGVSAPSALTGLIPNITREQAGLGGIGLSNNTTLARAAGAAAGGGGNFLSTLFGGAGGALLPLLGAGLGSSLGGQSGLGRLLGGIGGGAVGLGVSFGASVFGALGGGLGALGPALLAALGPAALIGAPLLIAGLLLGRAKARRQDEATSGDSLQRAIDQLKDLTRAANSGQLTSAADAEKSFKQIHAQFINETLQIKTKSVRESRLNNQGDITPPLHPDSLRALFEREVLPAVIAANVRKGVFDKLIPEFATGGFHQGVGLALLHDREMILNLQQQRRVEAIAGPGVFQAAGVPNAHVANNGTPSFATGGTFTAPRGGDVIISELTVELNVGTDFATSVFKAGGRTVDGRRVTVENLRIAHRNGEV
jgi:TP901 family phage tail tape measure protein